MQPIMYFSALLNLIQFLVSTLDASGFRTAGRREITPGARRKMMDMLERCTTDISGGL